MIFMYRRSSLLFLFVYRDEKGRESVPYLPKRF